VLKRSINFKDEQDYIIKSLPTDLVTVNSYPLFKKIKNPLTQAIGESN